jgi:hypothetical protein
VLQGRLANALLLSGDTAEATGLLDGLLARQEALDPALRDQLQRLAAIAWLRLGEQENCVHGHNAESCLMPIRGAGVHVRQRGARRAMELYQELLGRHPDDLEARWLLNVAGMTVEEWPEGVPERWRIPPSAFASEGDAPELRDVASAAGVARVGLAGGVAMEDFDGDGFLDLMVSSWGWSDELRAYRNRGDGSFEDVTQRAGLEGIVGGLNLVHADYDNDGLADVLVLRGGWQGLAGRFPDSLLRNRGGFAFEDVTEAAGLLDFHPSQTAAWDDYDGDGWLDLYVGNESTRRDPHPCRLFRNRGDGTFVDVAPELGLDVRGFVKAVVFGDYDDDGRPDLFVSRLGEPNALLHNDGPLAGGRWRFRDVTAEAGVAAPVDSFPAAFLDYDNDGHLDLFVSGYPSDVLRAGSTGVAADYLGLPTRDERPRLYRNRGDGTFEDVTGATGLHRVLHTMGFNFGDVDNDGWLDFYLGTGAPSLSALMPNRMFRNDRGRRFLDVTTAARVGHLQKGHGVAFGDYDNDGDQDVYIVIGGAFSGDGFARALFQNPGGGGHWIKLILEGRPSNRSAIGARLALDVDTAEGPRRIHSRVSTGGSFGSSTLRRELGLGSAARVRRLEVVWPSGRREAFEGLAGDRAYRIREGAGVPE